ncbi:hypothetical protein AB0J20_16295 [Micromonospora costi]|uniref:hypothetical protein n=1 Tax=Micromonospora costi TaxID=1530042 RepID=UPI0033F00308
MAPSLVASQTFVFADGNAGHVCDLGSAPPPGQADVLCVNSNTTVSTPAGFTAAPSAVANQGAYIFYRIAAGGEGSTVTVTTSGDHNTQVSWSRWSGVSAADDAIATSVNGSAGTSSPPHSTRTLAEAGELVIAFAALSNIGSPTPTSPSWSAGYTPLTAATQGTGTSGVVGFVGYKAGGGPAAESPSVSWTNNASNRYMLTLTFMASSSTSPALGAADAGLALDVAGSGRRGSTGAAGAGLDLAVAAAGSRGSVGAADVVLALTVAAQGQAPGVIPSAGSTPVGVALSVSAHGRSPGGSSGWLVRGETAVRVRAPLAGDGYGNQARDWNAAVRTELPGWGFAPRRGEEAPADGSQGVIVGLTGYGPPQVDVLPTDRLEVRGQVFDVVGEVGVWRSPLTGWEPGVEVALRRVYVAEG